MSYRLYQTRDGDMIDLIAWLHYGTSNGYTEKILDINYGDLETALSSLPPELPRGEGVLLPDPDAPQVRLIQLYD